MRQSLIPHLISVFYYYSSEDYPAPTSTTYQPPGFKLGITTRTKKDPYYRQNFNPIRHASVTWFIIPLSLSGLAAVFKLRWDQRAFPEVQTTPKEIWIVLAIFAAACFAVVMLLNLIRAVKYPRKIIKEWSHPRKFTHTHTDTYHKRSQCSNERGDMITNPHHEARTHIADAHTSTQAHTYTHARIQVHLLSHSCTHVFPHNRVPYVLCFFCFCFSSL